MKHFVIILLFIINICSSNKFINCKNIVNTNTLQINKLKKYKNEYLQIKKTIKENAIEQTIFRSVKITLFCINNFHNIFLLFDKTNIVNYFCKIIKFYKNTKKYILSQDILLFIQKILYLSMYFMIDSFNFFIIVCIRYYLIKKYNKILSNFTN
jgi:hypothetical protein